MDIDGDIDSGRGRCYGWWCGCLEVFDPPKFELHFYWVRIFIGKAVNWEGKMSSDRRANLFRTPDSTIANGTLVNTTHGSEIGTFDTRNVRSWQYPEPWLSQWIDFEEAFESAPIVAIGLKHINIAGGAVTLGMNTYADQINATGFMIHVDSVKDTYVYTAEVVWLAAPAYKASNATQYQVGTFSTLDNPYRTSQTAENAHRVTFPYPFTDFPTVVVWLEAFDFSQSGGWRMFAYATDVDLTGFTIHVDTWDDAIMYSGNASWIAFPAASENVDFGIVAPDYIHQMGTNSWPSSGWVDGDYVHTDFSAAMPDTIPVVLMAWTAMDSADSAGNGIALDVAGNVTDSGIDFQIGSFYNGTMYAGNASWLAVF